MTSWRCDQRSGEAGALHAGWPGAEDHPDEPAVAVCRVAGPAVVLGSTQAEASVDLDRASASGLLVARRRSGGGAVLVAPDDPVWIDAWVPAAHPLWTPDVARAFDWLGDTWVRALTQVGVSGLTAHRHGFVPCTRWSDLVCFGGVGTGEVLSSDGRKVVGLAQRRTRRGAWFHGACVLHWDPSPLVDVLALEPEERDAAVLGLRGVVVGAADLAGSARSRPVARSTVTAAFLGALPPA